MLNDTRDNLVSSFEVEDEKDLKDKLNLNYISLINKTHCVGKYDFPYVLSPNNVDIDYLALYSDKFEYNKTKNTCVCFYEYDNVFDGINGLYNSIFYKNDKKLNDYKERFKNVRYFISPDYTLCGDCPKAFNIFNIYKSRIVSLWLTLECRKLVIPNITYASERTFEYMLDGLEDCTIVAFSTKGSLRNLKQRELLQKAIIYTSDHLSKLNQIIIYDVSATNDSIEEQFEYPKSKNIQIIIPSNILKIRNQVIGGKTNG